MTSKIAFVFPGQGSQSIGMLNTLAIEHSLIKDTFAQASDVLNYDLWELIQDGPEDLLNKTEYTQPALLAAGVSVWKVWQQLAKQQPSLLAGHSLGEYTALVCADSISFEDAIALVAERGRLMQEAVADGQGAMAAIIGLDNDKVKEVCLEAQQDEVVSPANFNAIGQVVIAGDNEAVKRAMALAKQVGAKLVKQLPVSVPSHCMLMNHAAEKLAERLASIAIKTPTIPIIHNVDVALHENPDEIKRVLIDQLNHSVRWVETIQLMVTQGIEVIYECGPGKVLTGLNKRIDKGLTLVALNQPENFVNE